MRHFYLVILNSLVEKNFGEDPREALEREYLEEVNLQVKIGKPFKVFSYLSENGDRHTVEILFHVSLLAPNQKVKLSPAHIEYRWISIDEIEEYPISLEIKDGIIQGFQSYHSNEWIIDD